MVGGPSEVSPAAELRFAVCDRMDKEERNGCRKPKKPIAARHDTLKSIAARHDTLKPMAARPDAPEAHSNTP